MRLSENFNLIAGKKLSSFISFRASKAELEHLNSLSNEYDLNKSDVLRLALTKLYEAIKEEKNNKK